MTEAKATCIGATAVLLWGALALFTSWSESIPPFQLVAMTFTIAFLLALFKWLICGEKLTRHLKQPPAVWLTGIGGLFGYHFFYFLALKNAPAVEASLIAYLWPLLIVLFSAFLPGERLAWTHVSGAILGLVGCVILITKGDWISYDSAYLPGYLSAIACALIWSGYSVLSRYYGAVSTDVVGWFCGATALLGAVCHMLFETTALPADPGVWLAVGALGLGPVGLAFFSWDLGMKKGNIKVLGAFSYMAPLLSALLLVMFGEAIFTVSLLLACLAIVGGAVLAANDLSAKKRKDDDARV